MALKSARDRRKDTLILQEIVEVVQICLKCLLYSRLPELFLNLDDFCRALAC